MNEWNDSKVDCMVCGESLAGDETIGSPIGPVCKADADQAGGEAHPYWNWMTDDGFALDGKEIGVGQVLQFKIKGKWISGRVELAWQPVKKWYIVLPDNQVLDLTPFTPARLK
jgi:hypothetical protein